MQRGHLRQQRAALAAQRGQQADARVVALADDAGEVHHGQLHLAGHRGHRRRAAAPIGDVHDEAVAHGLEHLAADVHGRAVAAGGVAQAPGSAPRGRDGLRRRVGLQVAAGHQHEGDAREARDRRQVAQRVVADGRVQVGRDRQRAGRGQHQRVAVGRRLGHLPHGQRAAGAGAVLHHDLLPQLLGQAGSQQPRRGVGAAAGREGHDDAQGFGGPGFLGQGGGGGAGAQHRAQQGAADGFHGGSPRCRKAG